MRRWNDEQLLRERTAAREELRQRLVAAEAAVTKRLTAQHEAAQAVAVQAATELKEQLASNTLALRERGKVISLLQGELDRKERELQDLRKAQGIKKQELRNTDMIHVRPTHMSQFELQSATFIDRVGRALTLARCELDAAASEAAAGGEGGGGGEGEGGGGGGRQEGAARAGEEAAHQRLLRRRAGASERPDAAAEAGVRTEDASGGADLADGDRQTRPRHQHAALLVAGGSS
jgi:hypothetical protein